MKIKYFFYAILFLNTICSGQTKKNNFNVCGQELVKTELRERNPKAFDSIEAIFNKNLRAKLTQKRESLRTNNTYDYMIPVVVHVVHNGENLGQGTNISYHQIQSQIDALNAAYSNYSFTNYLGNNVQNQYNVASRRGPNGVDTRIRFCLAPNLGSVSIKGYTIPGEKGVIRYNSPTESAHQLSLAGQQSLMNLTHPLNSILNPKNYFNIWIVTSINTQRPGVEGYAPIPIDFPYATNGNWPLRGVVIRSDVFGDNSVNGNNYTLQPNLNTAVGGGTVNWDFSKGKILIHETGHALGLYHTFQSYSQNGTDSCNATYGDLVSDTPPCNISGLPTYTGNGIRNTCNESPDSDDMVENHMYYSTDNVRNTFTQGQKERMASAIDLIYPDLISELNLIQTGVIGNKGCEPAILSAEFSLPTSACVGQSISFSNIHADGNLATAWQWSVTPSTNVIINGANLYSTTIIFPYPGNYQIKLIANHNNETSTITKTILVDACQVNSCALKNGSTHLIYGSGLHLDFNSGTPVVRDDVNSPDPFYSIQSNFTQSDSNGNLLFYTDANWVWNAQHHIVNPNNPLSPLPVNGFPTVNSGQQQVAVPFPGHPNQYILLLPPEAELYSTNFGPTGRFRYVVIDTSQGNVTVSSPVVIYSTDRPNEILEQIAVIPHCNGLDYWVLIIEGIDFYHPRIRSYLLSSGGIKLMNTYSFLSYNGHSPLAEHGSMLSTNRDGDKIMVMFHQFIKVLDFDKSNGTFSHDRNLQKPINQSSIYYDAIFSPNGQKIYLRGGANLDCYNLTSSSITLFASNLYTGLPNDYNDANYFRRMFLGPDDQIYFGEQYLNSLCDPYANSNRLVQIKNPNSIAPTITSPFIVLNDANSCNPTPLGASPNMMITCKPDLALPNFNIVKMGCDNSVRLDFSGCYNQYSATIDWGDNSNPETGLFSDFIANHANHIYTQNGQYNITLTLSIDSLWDLNNNGIMTSNTVNLTPITKQISINPDLEAVITGAIESCKNSLPLQYTANSGSTGFYTWTITGTDNQIVGPHNGTGLNTVDVIWNNDGQLEVTYSQDNCSVTNQLNVTTHECEENNPPPTNDDCLLKTSPNPVVDNLKIESTSKVLEIWVYDVLGQMVLHEKTDLFSINLNLSDLQAAPYFIKINSCDKNNIIRIIKN